MAHANSEHDADFFTTHFIGQSNWDRALHTGQRLAARLYRDALTEQNVMIVDRDRFVDMIPQSAAEEIVEALKAHVNEIVLKHYGPDHLAHIVAFFKTPVGQKMLDDARRNRLFDRLHYQSQSDGLTGALPAGLTLQDHNRYRTFVATVAGQSFVETTWVLRRSLYYEIHEISRWPDPPLDRPFIAKIIRTDGVLRFSNLVARQALIDLADSGGQ